MDNNSISSIKTNGKNLYCIDSHLQKAIQKSIYKNGQACVFSQHTSASLLIMENADPSATTDLLNFFEKLVPENTPYFTHIYEGSDDMPSHIRMALGSTSINIPFSNKKLSLGTWQSIYLFEHRKNPQTRNVAISIIGN